MRPAEDFINDMLKHQCNPFAILAVAGQAGGKDWRKEVDVLLRQKGLLTETMVEAEREKTVTALRLKWKTERTNYLKKVIDDAELKAKREKKLQEEANSAKIQ